MIEIKLENVGKKFSSQWIFKGVSLSFQSSKIYSITGQNGSGKSTFLSLLSAYNSVSEGIILYLLDNKKVQNDTIATYISIVAPYIELVEEFTLSEIIDFHFQFNTFIINQNKESLIDFIQLTTSKNKIVGQFSSGMKQRLKLGLALFSNKPIVLLDEPTVNLDLQGIEWYKNQIVPFFNDRLIIISSNQAYEYDFADVIIDINNYKTMK